MNCFHRDEVASMLFSVGSRPKLLLPGVEQIRDIGDTVPKSSPRWRRKNKSGIAWLEEAAEDETAKQVDNEDRGKLVCIWAATGGPVSLDHEKTRRYVRR